MYDSAEEELKDIQQQEQKEIYFRLAEVKGYFSSGSPKICFYGEEEESKKEYSYLSPCHPDIGDKVVLGNINDTWIILGKLLYQIKDDTYAFKEHDHKGVYSEVNHNHDTAYAKLKHTHDTVYAKLAHNHDTAYAKLKHNHDTAYAVKDHIHEDYAPKDHTHTNYASEDHTHSKMQNVTIRELYIPSKVSFFGKTLSERYKTTESTETLSSGAGSADIIKRVNIILRALKQYGLLA